MAEDQSPIRRLFTESGKVYRGAAPYLAAIGLANIYSHIESYQLLSRSIRWIVGWYHYFTFQLFSFFSLDISPLARDALIIYCTLSLAVVRGSGKLIIAPIVVAIESWRNMGRSGRYVYLSYYLIGEEGRARHFSIADSWFTVIFAVTFISILGLSLENRSMILFVCAILSVLSWNVINLAFSGFRGSRWYMKNVPGLVRNSLSLLAFPMSFAVGHVLLIQFFLKAVLVTLVAFGLLLGLDFAFAAFADPVSGLKLQLPDPPAVR